MQTTYQTEAECLTCGLTATRTLSHAECGDTQTADDTCPRCSSRDVRDLGSDDDE